jgi:hypothetical protein
MIANKSEKQPKRSSQFMGIPHLKVNLQFFAGWDLWQSGDGRPARSPILGDDMKHIHPWIAGLIVIAVVAIGLTALLPARTDAQATATDAGVMVGRTIASRTVTLKFDRAKGEPKEVLGTAQFDNRVEAFWISVIGVDVKFGYGAEKQVHRELWSVKPSASSGGKEVELRGKLGLRDGSGDWDDSYEGTIDVMVTAVLSQ